MPFGTLPPGNLDGYNDPTNPLIDLSPITSFVDPPQPPPPPSLSCHSLKSLQQWQPQQKQVSKVVSQFQSNVVEADRKTHSLLELFFCDWIQTKLSLVGIHSSTLLLLA
ncbi:hypothetical protein J1N35_042670 [Gossypium stocksii]|uniref:Uncharacterized protein n=1 Tax=Gossypium stocksii TaxID=47602 RepID=A0A9D3U5Y7_9ROSI|nr:hypothetical protein J1N35_042670 [Gossypium stocksii]